MNNKLFCITNRSCLEKIRELRQGEGGADPIPRWIKAANQSRCELIPSRFEESVNNSCELVTIPARVRFFGSVVKLRLNRSPELRPMEQPWSSRGISSGVPPTEARCSQLSYRITYFFKEAYFGQRPGPGRHHRGFNSLANGYIACRNRSRGFESLNSAARCCDLYFLLCYTPTPCKKYRWSRATLLHVIKIFGWHTISKVPYHIPERTPSLKSVNIGRYRQAYIPCGPVSICCIFEQKSGAGG